MHKLNHYAGYFAIAVIVAVAIWVAYELMWGDAMDILVYWIMFWAIVGTHSMAYAFGRCRGYRAGEDQWQENQ